MTIRRPSFRLSVLAAVVAALVLAPEASAPSAAPAISPAAASASSGVSEGPLGYYRFPAIHGDRIVFTAEGDLWSVAAAGGTARRLTSHAEAETSAAISPDGTTVAFSASYEGPTEVYTMPLEGGLPVRRTWDGSGSDVTGWTPDGRVLYSTGRYSGLPDDRLTALDLRTGKEELQPLSQAADGAFDGSGALYFTRLRFQGSHTKRYQGGTAQSLWRYKPGAAEAEPLTRDWPGTSRTPMLYDGRVYFESDRDGTMNIWSMNPDGHDLKQHTKHRGLDLRNASSGSSRIVYQLGADIWLLDLKTGADAVVPIRLTSDFDQMREKWIKGPMEYLTSAHLAPKGDKVALTARGQIFVAPATQGRLVEATRAKGVRYRDGRFMPDGKSLVALSDATGEVELARLPANGVGSAETLTSDGQVLRWETSPSPDGKWIAHTNKDQELWLLEVATKKNSRIGVSADGDFTDLAWSPDSRWLGYTLPGRNNISRIWIYGTESKSATVLTTDRYDSESAAWSPDGKWLYFLSERNFESVVRSPWGPRQPEPFFDRQTNIYEVALVKGLRSPFQQDDELMPEKKKDDDKSAADSKGTGDSKASGDSKDAKGTGDAKGGDKGAKEAKGAGKSGDKKKDEPPKVTIDFDGIVDRLRLVPAPSGNYFNLEADAKRLYYIEADASTDPKLTLKTLAIDNKGDKPETFIEGIKYYELALDKSKILIRKDNDILIVEAGAKAPAELGKSTVNLKDWTFPLDPREEWRQMFDEAWRLERDYFYDKGMHGVDWRGMRDRYRPLVERVTDRYELSNLLAQMVSELSALHIFVGGGDFRKGADKVDPASLGARLRRDEAAGGYVVEHIYQTDPDQPEKLSPLARFGVDVTDGDVILSVNGVATLPAPDLSVLLRNQADRQVLLRVKRGKTERDVIVTPIPSGKEDDLRYSEWEYTRRQRVDEKSQSKIGYVHLRAMGSGNIAEWERGFYPVFDRQGLIIDVRHNQGGNIDSWILEKLMRRAWMYWQPRVGNPYWNMQYAFRGPMVVLCDEWTASDGEAFAEGFRRLGLGKVIGTRTWGGEIWLSASNRLVNRGIATAAETGVYGPEGIWLIEGHGVEPDIVVDNLPHATAGGADAQLDAAVSQLLDEIRSKPQPVPPAPHYPDKSLPPAARN